jgi:uncharacterized integral membrane protein
VDIRPSSRGVVENLVAQVIWVMLALLSIIIIIIIVFGTTDVRKILVSKVSFPVWLVIVVAVMTAISGVVVFIMARRASVVRGRMDATKENVALMQARARLKPPARVVRSTRFGRWILSEKLEARTAFRQELDKAILDEGVDVRRIWNVSSLDDVQRLRQVLQDYHGRANHSIRAYFDLPDHALPELLVVDGRGASMSFPSTRSPRDLDWMIRFNRND